jgi:hypothetical protein
MKWLLTLAGLLVAIVAVVAITAIERAGVPPRRLAPYLEHRASGHRAEIEGAARFVAGVLVALDRGGERFRAPVPIPRSSGAKATARSANVVVVASVDEALRAIAQARPGDAITFVPGVYRFRGAYIAARAPGTHAAPIVVRAVAPGSVVLEFDMIEGFLVTAPYWTFENLAIRGVCRNHSDCEHAFHVVGAATHFVARNNDVADFNAQFKINGQAGAYPDYGVIEGNTIHNGSVRDTGNPVAPIDLVAASHWRIRGNRITDFVKGRGDRISTGGFAKGAGADNRFEANVVVCEDRLRGAPGQRVGLSLGDGGSGHAFCRDGRCITEQERSAIVSNLIAYCSDDGIYLNRAAISRVAHNTLIDTGGIVARFAETSADVEGNIVDGPIRAAAGASIHPRENIATRVSELYVGWHPARRLFDDALALDLRWRDPPPRRRGLGAAPPDLCGGRRPLQAAYGAFEDIENCGLGTN